MSLPLALPSIDCFDLCVWLLLVVVSAVLLHYKALKCNLTSTVVITYSLSFAWECFDYLSQLLYILLGQNGWLKQGQGREGLLCSQFKVMASSL